MTVAADYPELVRLAAEAGEARRLGIVEPAAALEAQHALQELDRLRADVERLRELAGGAQ